MIMCRQHKPKPMNPNNNANIIKRNRNAAPVHINAAMPPNTRERLKEASVSFLNINYRITNFSVLSLVPSTIKL